MAQKFALVVTENYDLKFKDKWIETKQILW